MGQVVTGRLNIEREQLLANYDRQPFEFAHNLSELPMFGAARLAALARAFAGHPTEYYVSAAAPSAATEFNSVRAGHYSPEQALQCLESAAVRILMKRPENFDPDFRELLDSLCEQMLSLRSLARGEHIERLEGAVFVTSARSITPCHFDPEIGFFAQIAGRKIYHVYAPRSMNEPELEDFYHLGERSICQVNPSSRDALQEHVFQLDAGLGFHQPQNSPHWVETANERSVSFTMVMETNFTRARGRTRAFNHYLRRVGLTPTLPGERPVLDGVKASAMRVVLPLQRRARRWLRH